MATTHRRVRFFFGDEILEGDVVEEIPTPTIGAVDRTTLSVDVDGARYRVLDAETIDV